jgi:hypothetical protein
MRPASLSGCFFLIIATTGIGIAAATTASAQVGAPKIETEATEWISNRSEPGYFEVLLPFEANISSYDESDPKKDLQHGHFVGGAIDPEVRFLATRWVYSGGKAMADKYFDNVVGINCTECSSRGSQTVSGGYEGVVVEKIKPEGVVITLAVLAEVDLITLVVVAKPSRIDDARRQAKRFFGSLKIGRLPMSGRGDR